ncbi:NUDIX domain-containing protein [Saccharicrinis sp. FJH54]|uniref:NUDIX domain-containing protein n=1 Tax=Saccharicrinis sp. FJH54 TaxID=3344665 RepID=UPI0035D41017
MIANKSKNMKESTVLEPNELFSFCPRCGSDTIESHEENTAIKCKKCGFIYFFNASGAVILVVQNDSDELLVTKRAFEPYKGKLDLPGGFIMPGETAEAALIREVKEELNVDVYDLNYCFSLANKYPYAGMFVNTVDLVFKGKIKDIQSLKAGDDVASYTFIKVDELKPEDFGVESVRKAVMDMVLNKPEA